MQFDDKIKNLLGQMTLKEKLGQLNQLGGSIYGRVNEQEFERMIENGEVGSFLSSQGAKKLNGLQRIAMEKSRLKIPLIFAGDVIHGIKTIFPTPFAESCSWEPELARRTAEAAAKEATALGLKWTFAPMVDIARDCRWGRIIEGAGEDAYLGGLFAAARVRGFQGSGEVIDDVHMAACLKHYVAYGAAEGGKDYNTVSLSDYNLHNVYLPPFKAGVDAGAKSVMTSFNDLNGIPCSTHPYLVNEVLKKLWRFRGVVVSDWQSIIETVKHGYCEDFSDAAKEGLNAGVSVDMAGEAYISCGEKLVSAGIISEEIVDGLVCEVLRLKFELNLFDNPYVNESREQTDIMTENALALALESGEKSIVLLKNDGILPLKEKKKILLVGKLAEQNAEMHGSWASGETAEHTINIADGLRELYQVTYVEGYDLDDYSEGDFEMIKNLAADADCIFAVAGESIREGGEAHSKAAVELRENHVRALKFCAGLGKPLVAVLINGRPLALSHIVEECNAVVEGFQLGTMTGKALANIISGRKNPQGRLTATFPRKTGQCPLYYNSFSTGRPCRDDDHYTSKYLDCKENGLFNFGFGLSYTEFMLTEIKTDKQKYLPTDEITVSLRLANTGKTDGREVVQVYVGAAFSKPIRPVKELKAFACKDLKAGESVNMEIVLSAEELGYFESAQLKKEVKKGQYYIFVGKNSLENERLKIEIM